MNLNRSWKPFVLAVALAAASIVAMAARPSFSPVVDAPAIYAAKCAKCHGSDGKGTEKYKAKGVKDFTDATWQKKRSDAQFTASIQNGKGDVMPGWKSKLSGEEIKALVALVRGFKK